MSSLRRPGLTASASSRPNATSNARTGANTTAHLKSSTTSTATSRRNLASAQPTSTHGGSDSSAPPSMAPSTPPKERLRQVAGKMGGGVGGSQVRRRGEGEETNIQVVVRVRGRAPSEIRTSDSSILSTSGPRGRQIFVATEPPPVSSLSMQPSLVAEMPREKTYNFDQAFGPEADQGMIYQDVVGPILEQVMAGYNCTIFAYGQTGTGKTYTMEGDLTSHMGTYSADAGIIPRTLYRLFHTLELSRDEYSVRASFVELYNEELRDLLSTDLPAPLSAGSTQPMSQGVGASAAPPASSASSAANGQAFIRDGPPGGLKIYEDGKGRGVVIQGLEETPMRDAEDGLNILRRGSQKRQIAATRCNEQSSVFTLTVHIKETSSKGEDVLRIGKLNLVDLAGSENIGRSGAENKRAREAGMINQSLLTLGRVINALVEKSSHVPYRESKLTRLLQESLGGRTKTCIIATVSPSKANLEETLSTLDYALRAKSIQNKPEVNQRMTRAALIKEYVAEIERLKGDLLAAREKNGIFMSPESWKLLQGEHEERGRSVDELRRQAEVVESKLSSLKEQFEQNMQLLLKRDSEVKAAKAECAEKTAELEKVLERIEELRAAVEEERMLKEAYGESEKKLDRVARELRNVAQQSTSDVGGLFAKLERKSGVEATNLALVAECQTSLSSMTAELEGRASDFRHVHETFLSGLISGLSTFAAREDHELASNAAFISERLTKFDGDANTLEQMHVLADGNVEEVAKRMDEMRKGLAESSSARTEMLREECARISTRLVESNAAQLDTVKTAFERMANLMSVVVRSAETHAALEAERIQEAREMANRAAEEEISTLRAQNEALSRMLSEERSRSDNAREKLVGDIAGLLKGFTEQRSGELEDAVGAVQAQMGEAERAPQVFAQRHGETMDALLSSGKEYVAQLGQRGKECAEQKVRGEKSLEEGQGALKDALGEFGTGFAKSVGEQEEQVQGAMVEMGDAMQMLRTEATSARQSQSAQLAVLQSGVGEMCGGIQQDLETAREDVRQMAEGAVQVAEEHRKLGLSFLSGTASHLSNMRSETRAYLSKKLVQDISTGTTPQKRAWNYEKRWELVPEGREEALVAARRARLARKEMRGTENEGEEGDVRMSRESSADGDWTAMAPDVDTASIMSVDQFEPNNPLAFARPKRASRSNVVSPSSTPTALGGAPRALREISYDSNVPLLVEQESASSGEKSAVGVNVAGVGHASGKGLHAPNTASVQASGETWGPTSKKARSGA